MKSRNILFILSILAFLSVTLSLGKESPFKPVHVAEQSEQFIESQLMDLEQEEEVVEAIPVEKSKPVDLAIEPVSVPPVEVEQETPVYHDDDFIIVGLGDSLTAGIGDNTKQGYVGHVKSLFETGDNKVKLINLGVRGHDTTKLLKKLKDPAVQNAVAHADVIFMTIGGNDIIKVVKKNLLHLEMPLFQKQEKVYTEKLSEVLATVRALNQNSKIYYVGLFNPFYEAFPEIEEMNEIVESWNESSIQVLKNYPNTDYIPIVDLFEQNTMSLLAHDYFHPNDEGYKLIGERIGVYLGIGLPFFQTAER